MKAQGVLALWAVDTMCIDIDKTRKEFFKKSISVGHHNIQYPWMQIMLMILNCIKGLETFEGGAKSPSAQTLRDRLNLEGEWLEHFHSSMWNISKWFLQVYKHLKWFISLDETYVPFFGNRKKLNMELERRGGSKFIHGYRTKTPGATGSFCFLVISLCCAKIRIPMAIEIVKVGEPYYPWLKPWLERLLAIAPQAIILADRGFGKATWFYMLMEELGAKYIVRIPLRKKETKNKISHGKTHVQQWLKDTKTKEKVLLDLYIAHDDQDREYVLASNIEDKSPKQLLAIYLNRWDLENIFKDADRVELPTSSRNPLMRLYCVVASFLIFTLWQVGRLSKICNCSLRRFVKQCLDQLCKLLKCVISPLGEILRHHT
jgi:hypothetical protein